jgi:hypothetical protein
MSRGARTVRYATGTATNPITIKNLYKYGGAVWAIVYLWLGLLDAGTLAGAVQVMLDVYVMKLFGWPWDELLLADTLFGLVRSHVQTWAVGWIAATVKYGINS